VSGDRVPGSEHPLRRRPSSGPAYKGQPLRQSYQADFVCFDQIIVELKAVRELAPEHRAQVLNYLKATGPRLGLLVNFGSAPRARIERLVHRSALPPLPFVKFVRFVEEKPHRRVDPLALR